MRAGFDALEGAAHCPCWPAASRRRNGIQLHCIEESAQSYTPPQEHTFELGERAAVLHQVDQPAIIPHLAEVEGKKFPYEVRAGLAAAARWPSC